jgi:hypothetical protein
MTEGRFKSVREFVTVLATLKRMEDADSVSEDYKPAEIYSLTNRSRRLGLRALELASRDEAQDPEGAHELRAMAGRHRQDLRRAARAIAGRPTIIDWRAFRMLIAAYRGVEEELPPISTEDRNLYELDGADLTVYDDPFDL